MTCPCILIYFLITWRGKLSKIRIGVLYVLFTHQASDGVKHVIMNFQSCSKRTGTIFSSIKRASSFKSIHGNNNRVTKLGNVQFHGTSLPPYGRSGSVHTLALLCSCKRNNKHYTKVRYSILYIHMHNFLISLSLANVPDSTPVL